MILSTKTKKTIGKLVIALTVISTLNGIKNITTQEAKADTKEVVLDYVVSQGDTLYDIAKNYKKDGQDLRKFVYQIQKENDLFGKHIQPNQTLKITVKQ